jgi:hypothetical protein
MLPWGHAGVGYVAYHLWLRLRNRLPPNGVAVVALLFGTQFPDLLDKPGAWIFGVLPSGRSFGHSLLTLGLVGLLVVLWLRRTRRADPRVWWAFLGGWFSHLLTDGYSILFDSETCLRYLLWPLVSTCGYENDTSALDWLAAFEFSQRQLLGVAFALSAALVWWFDGRPGLQTIRTALDGKDRT